MHVYGRVIFGRKLENQVTNIMSTIHLTLTKFALFCLKKSHGKINSNKNKGSLSLKSSRKQLQNDQIVW